jgi:cellulose synthase/poly-beta-1,6-N-acetylglucosamine synthase-like glycosyltransferase
VDDGGCLIVVWNGPRTASHDCCRRALAGGAAIWLEFPDRLGAAIARNQGVAWLAGRARVLAFVDADDIAHPDWLSRLCEPLTSGDADLAGGSLELTSQGRTYTVEPGRDFWHRQALYGSNCALTRESWARLGGFRSGVGTCEDTDLAWRAGDLGLRITLVKTAVVRYALRHGWAEWRQRVTWGRSSVALLRAHDLPLSRDLPNLRGLVGHKRSHGFASSPLVAGLGQYAGQWAGRLLDRVPAMRDLAIDQHFL